MLSGLKELWYPTVESLWYHDATEINEIVLLKDDMVSKKIKTIIVVNGNVHLYVFHPIVQPDVIENSILSFEYNSVGPIEKVGNDVQKDNMDEVSNVTEDIFEESHNEVKEKLDGTIELGEESNEGGITKNVTNKRGNIENLTTERGTTTIKQYSSVNGTT